MVWPRAIQVRSRHEAGGQRSGRRHKRAMLTVGPREAMGLLRGSTTGGALMRGMPGAALRTTGNLFRGGIDGIKSMNNAARASYEA